jgi:glyoxylase-like metal-dependent hydrolase (beta-lactamase superfamily II)
MPLEPITDEMWGLSCELRQPGGVRLPLRMVVCRLGGRRLLLHSPVPIDDAAAAALDDLGEVAHLVAPSLLHHKWIEPAAGRWPAATVWLAPGLAARYPALAATTLPADAPAAWQGELEQVRIAGAPRIEETVFFHPASRTLVCTDLVFHVTRPANLRTRLVLRLMGAGGGRLAASRAWRLLVRDRAAAAASVRRVAAWDLDRIVPAHGEVVERGGRTALAAACLERIGGRAALPG